MLKKSGHSFTVDYYCLGALLFELVSGLPPHYSHDRKKIFEGILNDKIAFPSYFSSSLKELIKGLTNKNPSKRTGYKGGILEILSQKWCKGLRMDFLLKKRYQPPIKPSLIGENFNFNDTEMINIQDFYTKERVDLKNLNLLDEKALKNLKKLSISSEFSNFEDKDHLNCMFDKFANFSFYSFGESSNYNPNSMILTNIFEEEERIIFEDEINNNFFNKKNNGKYFNKSQIIIKKSQAPLGDVTCFNLASDDEAEQNKLPFNRIEKVNSIKESNKTEVACYKSRKLMKIESKIEKSNKTEGFY